MVIISQRFGQNLKNSVNIWKVFVKIINGFVQFDGY